MHAYVVVDLGFGDAGKGLITDFLVRQNKAGLVVRYNGGAQAGHNVVTPDGRHHTFSQFGSGTFVPGVKTWFSKHVIIHPTALLLEGDTLVQKGVPDAFQRLHVSGLCPVITPFHQAANRIHESLRGGERHGSCGVGVGEVAEDLQDGVDDLVTADDLRNTRLLHSKLGSIRTRKKDQLIRVYGEQSLQAITGLEWQIFTDDGVCEAWMAQLKRFNDLGLVKPDVYFAELACLTQSVVFEGAQGVLIDAGIGFHPYTSWTNCTTENAKEILNYYAPQATSTTLGVTRCYMVRHGPGPLPTETNELAPLIHEHNGRNDWQGCVRYGWFDGLLLRYALREIGGVDALAVTHLDLLPRLKEWKFCHEYKPSLFENDSFERNEKTDSIIGLKTQDNLSFEARDTISKMLGDVEPILQAESVDEKVVLNTLSELCQQKIDWIARGACSSDIFESR